MHVLLFINSFLFSTTINTSYIQNQRLPTSQKENYSTFLPPLDHNAPTATYYSTSKILKIGPSTPRTLFNPLYLYIVYTVSYSTIYFILFFLFLRIETQKNRRKWQLVSIHNSQGRLQKQELLPQNIPLVVPFIISVHIFHLRRNWPFSLQFKPTIFNFSCTTLKFSNGFRWVYSSLFHKNMSHVCPKFPVWGMKARNI